MEILLILFLFGICCLPCSQVSNAQETENPQLSVISSDSEPVELSSKTLQDLAKNITYSKGIYREEGDLRRSVLHKAKLDSSSNAVKDILSKLESENNTVELLEKLEDLVHQYDVAVYFINVRGLQIVSPLLFSPDEEIVCWSALVLGAAMQGNPTVQKAARDLNIGRRFLYLLSHKSSVVTSRIVFAVSTFLRNFPEAQHDFLVERGFVKFTEVLLNKQITTSTKLKIVTLLSDLANELEFRPTNATMKVILSNDEKKSDLQRLFVGEIQDHGICNFLLYLLELHDYDTHQKTISAVVSLQDICFEQFKGVLHEKLERIIKFYFSKNYIYPIVDEELLLPLMDDIRVLLIKFSPTNATYSNATEVTTFFNIYKTFFQRDEL